MVILTQELTKKALTTRYLTGANTLH